VAARLKGHPEHKGCDLESSSYYESHNVREGECLVSTLDGDEPSSADLMRKEFKSKYVKAINKNLKPVSEQGILFKAEPGGDPTPVKGRATEPGTLLPADSGHPASQAYKEWQNGIGSLGNLKKAQDDYYSAGGRPTARLGNGPDTRPAWDPSRYRAARPNESVESIVDSLMCYEGSIDEFLDQALNFINGACS
jgi:hypothetical protein